MEERKTKAGPLRIRSGQAFGSAEVRFAQDDSEVRRKGNFKSTDLFASEALAPLNGLAYDLTACRKGAFSVQIQTNVPQGLKPSIDYIGFVPGMNPRPTARISFSATC